MSATIASPVILLC